MDDVQVDGHFQVRHAREAVALDRVLADVAEEALGARSTT
jgi:hypothetical protein